MGFGGMGATLCSRVLSGSVGLYWITNGGPDPYHYYGFALPNPEDQPYSIVEAAIVPGLHFPYGWDVEPNVPV